MSSITTSQTSELTDPKLRAIGKRVLRMLQLEAEKAVAHHAEPANFPIDPNSAEQIFLARFKELTPTKQKAATEKTMFSVKSPEATRAQFYGDLSKVDLHKNTAVEAQVNALGLPATLKLPESHLRSLTQLHGQILESHLAAAVAAAGEIAPANITNKLELRIHKVKCVDETDPEFWGDDEISLGGTTVDESGDVSKVSVFVVKNDFDDGEQQIYSPPKRFTSFNLMGGTTFPKSYFVTLVLAETDMGSHFADFISKLSEKVKAKVLQLVAAAVGAAIGSTVPGIGTIVGAVTGWVMANVFEYLKGLFGDDVFKPVTVSINIPSLNTRWSGGKTDSPEGVVTFKGYGGTYQLTYDWRLFA